MLAVCAPTAGQSTITSCRQLIILTRGGFERFFGKMAEGGFRILDTWVWASAAGHSLRVPGRPLQAE